MGSSSSDSSSLSFSAFEYVSTAEVRTADIGQPVSPFRASKIYINSTNKKNITNSNSLSEGGLLNLSHKMTPDKPSTTPKEHKIVKKFSLSALRAKLPFSRSPNSAARQREGSSPGSDGKAFTPTRAIEHEYCAEGERLRLLSIQRQKQDPAVSPPAVSGPWMASLHAPYTSSTLAPTGTPSLAAQRVRPSSRRSSNPYQAVSEVNSPWFRTRDISSEQAPSGSSMPLPNNTFNKGYRDPGSCSVAMEGDDIFEDDLPIPRRVPSAISPFLLSQSKYSSVLVTPTEVITTPPAGKRKGSNRNYYGARSGAQRESTRETWGPTTSRSTSDLRNLFSRPHATVQPSLPSTSMPLRSSTSMASLRASDSPSLGRASERLTRSLPRKSVNALGISYDSGNEVFIAEEDEEVDVIKRPEEGKRWVSEKEKREEREMSLEYHRSLNEMNKGYSCVPSA